jgi:hypothetical protein
MSVGAYLYKVGFVFQSLFNTRLQGVLPKIGKDTKLSFAPHCLSEALHIHRAILPESQRLAE